jgi:hypothetical protein
MKPKIILKCSKCGRNITRLNRVRNPVCFDCRTEMQNELARIKRDGNHKLTLVKLKTVYLKKIEDIDKELLELEK